MCLKQFLTQSAVLGCLRQQFLVITLYPHVFCQLSPDHIPLASAMSSDGND